MIPFVILLEHSEMPRHDFLQLQDHMCLWGFIRLWRGDQRREFTDKCVLQRQSQRTLCLILNTFKQMSLIPHNYNPVVSNNQKNSPDQSTVSRVQK